MLRLARNQSSKVSHKVVCEKDEGENKLNLALAAPHSPLSFPYQPSNDYPQLQHHRQPQTRSHLRHLAQPAGGHRAQEERQERAYAPVPPRVRSPPARQQLLVDEQVAQEGRQHDCRDLVEGQHARRHDLARGLERKQRDGKDLHPLDRGAGVLGAPADGTGFDEDGGGQEGEGLRAE